MVSERASRFVGPISYPALDLALCRLIEAALPAIFDLCSPSTMTLEPFDSRTQYEARAALFTECFPETIGTPGGTEAHYRWKFHGIGGETKSYEYGAYEDGELIGYYAAIPYRYRHQGAEYPVAMVCDVMTGIKARGKGVFTRLGVYSTDQFKESGLEFAIGYPIRPEVIPGHLKAGWKKMFKLPLYIRFLSMTSLLRQRKAGWLAPVANAALTVLDLPIRRLACGSGGFAVADYAGDQLAAIPGLDSFLEQWQAEQMIALRKSRDFLSWRLGAPEKRYRIFVANKGDTVVGCMITTETLKEGVPAMAILDLSCLASKERAARALMAAAAVTAKSRGMEAMLLMFSAHAARKFGLLTMGFLRSPFTFWVIVKNLGGQISQGVVENEANWHLGWIDSDDL